MNDGGYIVAGLAFQSSIGYRNYLIKTDSVGNIIWTKTFFYGSGLGSADNVSVLQTNDGGFAVASTMPINYNYAVLLKFQSDGNLLWSKYYVKNSTMANSSASELIQTNDGGFIILGSTSTYSYSHHSFCLIKTDSVGTSEWSKTFGSDGNGYPYSIRQTNDGGYIIAGHESTGIQNMFLIKTDNNGNHIWSKTYGGAGYQWANSVKQTSDGGYIVSGYSYYNSWPTPEGFVIIKTDSLGNSGCAGESIPIDSATVNTSIVATNFIPTISSLSLDTNITITMNPSNLIVITPCPFTGINEINQDVLITNVFPNPFTSQTTIVFSKEQKLTTIKIFDVLGNEINTIYFTGSQLTIEKGEMTAGIYFISITDVKKNTINKKIIIQ